MRRVLLLSIGLTIGLWAAACASARTPFSDGQNRGQTIEIEVRNLNFDQATLWVLRMGERSRLGIVEGKQDRTFQVAWRAPAPLRIQVQLQGGDRCTTRAVQVDPGDSLVMEVASDLVSDPDCT